ncbi:MAG: putative N-acetylmannosamine-6-phosphate 2-epimerase [Bryobacterales bacterium]|nr:putative N-acetylmannosamine-6-phosphate 2-epimerase [Bryobacterales bacterium]
MILSSLKHRLIVSCQAPDGDPFRDPDSMARFAEAAALGGAAGIRANGPEDIRAIRARVDLPVFGIQKSIASDGRVLITPSVKSAQAVVEAGASIVAIDCTARGRRYGAFERLREIRNRLRVPVMADIATVEEAIAAVEAGADTVASTMRGYTDETAGVTRFEPEFIAELVRCVPVPVLAEGRVSTPEEAASALRAGAHAVIVGTAITAPRRIVQVFAGAMDRERRRLVTGQVAGIDLGGTNTKYGLVASDGRLLSEGVAPTPWSAGREALLGHLKRIARECVEGGGAASIGIATAGWVDPSSGEVVYATGNLPGWTGAQIAAEVSEAVGLPVAVENDANALAVAEFRFGAARSARNFVVITLGTGLGGGCYIDGKLNHGSHFFANAIGHMPVEPDGAPCTCGLRGCLEAYTNAAALLRRAPQFANAEQLIHAANGGDESARAAISAQAVYLASGLAAVVQLLDPELLVLSGGLVQNNTLLLTRVREELSRRLTVWDQRRLEVCASGLGYHGGVLGAAAVAFERC